MASWWQSIFNAGRPLFPYIGLVVLLCLGLALVVLLAYVLYRSTRRVGGMLRYARWRAQVTGARARAGWRARQGLDVQVLLAGSDEPMTLRHLLASQRARVPLLPLLLLLPSRLRIERESRRSGLPAAPQTAHRPVLVVIRLEAGDSSRADADAGDVAGGGWAPMAAHAFAAPSASAPGASGAPFAAGLSGGTAAGAPATGYSTGVSGATGAARLAPPPDAQVLEAQLTDESITLTLDALFEGAAQHSRQRAFLRTCRDLVRGSVIEALVLEIDCAFITHLKQPRFQAQFDFIAQLAAQRHRLLPVTIRFTHTRSLAGLDALRLLSERDFATLPRWQGALALETDAAASASAYWCAALEAHAQASLLAAAPAQAHTAVQALAVLPTYARATAFLASQLEVLAVSLRRVSAQAVLEGLALKTRAESAHACAKAAGLRSYDDYPVTTLRVARQRRALRVAQVALMGSALVLLRWVPATFDGGAALARELARGTAWLQDFQQLPISDGAAPDLASAERLAGEIARLERLSTWFVLAPASWVDHPREATITALAGEGYRAFTFGRVQWLATRNIVGRIETPPPGVSFSAATSEELPAARALRDYLTQQERIRSLAALADDGHQRLRYQDFIAFLGGDEPSLTPGLTPLAPGAVDWGAPLPEAAYGLLRAGGALRAGSAADTVTMARTAMRLWQGVLDEAFEHAPVAVNAALVDAGCSVLAAGQMSEAGLTTLARAAQALAATPDAQGSAQVTGSTADAAKYLEASLSRMAQSPLLPTQNVAEMASAANSRREALRAHLLAMRITGVGAPFTLSATGTIVPSAGLHQLADALDQASAQQFGVDASQPVTPLPSGALTWERATLAQASGLAGAWSDFQSQTLQVFNPAFRAGLTGLMRQRYQHAVLVTLAQGARPLDPGNASASAGDASSAALRSRAQALQQGAHILHLAFPEAGDAMPGYSAVHARLQREVDQTFDALTQAWNRRPPYAATLAQLADWVRAGPDGQVAASALGAGVGERLVLIRASVQNDYAGTADALVHTADELGMSEVDDSALGQWRSFLAALRGLDQDAWGNGLFRMEQTLKAVDSWSSPAQCTQLPAPGRESAGTDLFSQTYAQAGVQLARACRERRALVATRREAAFVSWFNQNIAGHAPFGPSAGAGELSYERFVEVLRRYHDMRVDGVPTSDEPEDMRQFRRQMDALVASFPNATAPAAAGGADPGAGTAVGGSAVPGAVRPGPVGLAMKLALREPRDEEVAGDQIIEWTWRSGPRSWSLRNTPAAWSWLPGEPLTLTLRVARESAWQPVSASADEPPYTVQGRSVTFSFDGTWSLLAMLRRHQVRVDASGDIVLGFEVNLTGTAGNTRARVFVTLRPEVSPGVLALGLPRHAPDGTGSPAGTGGAGEADGSGPLPPLPGGPQPPQPGATRPYVRERRHGMPTPAFATEAAWSQ